MDWPLAHPLKSHKKLARRVWDLDLARTVTHLWFSREYGSGGANCALLVAGRIKPEAWQKLACPVSNRRPSLIGLSRGGANVLSSQTLGTSYPNDGGRMRKSLLALAFGAIAALGMPSTHAADLGTDGASTLIHRAHERHAMHRAQGSDGCGRVWKCLPEGCDWRLICPRSCPDPYTCYSLYGGYGPEGGTRFWGAYTNLGWGYSGNRVILPSWR
jgi:hypothetical protein